MVGIPNTVSVKLTGSQTKVQKESVAKNFKAKLNLRNAQIGDDQKVKIEIKPARRKVIAATKILNEIFNSFIIMGKNKKLRNNSPIDGCGNSIPNKALDTSERKKYGINTTIKYITKYMAKVIITTS